MLPKKFEKLIRECVVEVLQENLAEGFDPTSQGPNPTEENPYPRLNARMAKLEESDTIYKDREGGQWVYWMDNRDSGGKIRINPANVEKYLKQGYRLIALEPWNDPKAVDGLRKENEHGRYAQQAGAGQFDPRTFGKLTEGGPDEDVITKVKKEVYAALEKEGFESHGDEPRDYVEYYLNGFMTVQVSVGYDSKAARVERYYDSEMVNNMPGHNVVKSFPVPIPYNAEFVQKFIKYAIALKRAGVGDESIFGGIEDLEESRRQQTIDVDWICPHCKQEIVVPVDVESPSDYIASTECEHCSNGIGSPQLDEKVMQAVQDYFVGRAEYMRDTRQDLNETLELTPTGGADTNSFLIRGEKAKQFVLGYLRHNPTHTQLPIERVKNSLEGRVNSEEMNKILQSLEMDGLIRIFGNGKFIKILPLLHGASHDPKDTWQNAKRQPDPDMSHYMGDGDRT